MNGKGHLAIVACGLSEEEAKTILKRVKIHICGVTLAADEAVIGYGWNVYAIWAGDIAENMNIPRSMVMGSEERFVQAVVTQVIISKLTETVVKLEGNT
jgi:hypothetical protein